MSNFFYIICCDPSLVKRDHEKLFMNSIGFPHILLRGAAIAFPRVVGLAM